MFPPPEQKWPDLLKLKERIEPHSGFVQEFARDNGIVMRNDGFGQPHEKIVRELIDPDQFIHLNNPMEYLDFLGLPDHCFFPPLQIQMDDRDIPIGINDPHVT